MTVNGQRAQLGQSADAGCDEILVDGRPLQARPELCWLMLNKPRGYVTSLHDERGRRDVRALVEGCGRRVFPVGLLDRDSEGLLLFTNDGALANALLHPSGEVEKTYLVTVGGFRPQALELLRSPLRIDGYRIRPAQVTLVMQQPDGRAQLRITIHEGRNRQIRKMCALAGLTVQRLQRVAEAGLELGALPPGQWRYLSEAELAALRAHARGEEICRKSCTKNLQNPD